MRCSKETASCRKEKLQFAKLKGKASKRFADEPIIFELLKATCVCSGKGVDKNKQLVANEIIIDENNRQLLVKVTLNERKRQSPSPRIRDTSSLHATWNVNNCSEFSPKVLFEGKDTVDFPTLFAVYNDERVLSLERRLSIGSQYNIVRIKAQKIMKQNQVRSQALWIQTMTIT